MTCQNGEIENSEIAIWPDRTISSDPYIIDKPLEKGKLKMPQKLVFIDVGCGKGYSAKNTEKMLESFGHEVYIIGVIPPIHSIPGNPEFGKMELRHIKETIGKDGDVVCAFGQFLLFRDDSRI